MDTINHLPVSAISAWALFVSEKFKPMALNM